MKGKYMAKYKHTKITTEKVQIEGILDIETMTVNVDEEIINIVDELKDFNGKSIALTFVEKTEEDVDNEM